MVTLNFVLNASMSSTSPLCALKRPKVTIRSTRPRGARRGMASRSIPLGMGSTRAVRDPRCRTYAETHGAAVATAR